MNPVVIDISSADDLRDVVHRAVQALAEDKLVVFPTETVYGLAASALSPLAVERLIEAKGRDEGQPLTLAIKSAEDALDYVPDLSRLGRRLARRCWPGPVTLVADHRHSDSLLNRLPESVQKHVIPNGSVGLRVPAHDLMLDVLRMLVGPIVLTSANRHGEADPMSAEDAIEQLGDKVHLVLDDGRSRFGQPSSVIRVKGHEFEILREGVVSKQNVSRLASFMVLIVCTGNTCRSPMGELITRKLIADRMGCKMDELEDRGVIVASAGTSAMPGAAASPQSVQVMNSVGIDLSKHESQPIRENLVRHADLILTMTRRHRDAIVAHWPDVAARTEVLCLDGSDIADPVGGPVDLYARCAEQMNQELVKRVADWEF